MRTTVRVIESITEGVGRVACWLCVLLVLVIVYEVIARYFFGAPTIWAHETGTMMGIAIASLGWAYTHKHRGHVSIDTLYARFSRRRQALIDVVCSFLFLFPLMIALNWIASRRALYALSMDERLTMTFWHPPAAPIRIVVLLGLALFLLQGLAHLIRDLYVLIKGRPL